MYAKFLFFSIDIVQIIDSYQSSLASPNKNWQVELPTIKSYAIKVQAIFFQQY